MCEGKLLVKKCGCEGGFEGCGQGGVKLQCSPVCPSYKQPDCPAEMHGRGELPADYRIISGTCRDDCG